MSGFDELGDEFASDEANEAWDTIWAAYSAGGQPDITSEQLPLRSVLTLPIGRVEVRGADPGLELCLVPSVDGLETATPPLDQDFEDGNSAVLTLDLRSDDDGRIGYQVLNPRGDGVANGVLEDSESASELLDRLIDVSVESDTTRVYLNSACVELDGTGVLVLSSDASARASVVGSMVARGARYLSDSLIALSPGTQTVTGVGRRRMDVDAAGTIAFTRIDVILSVEQAVDPREHLDADPYGLDAIPAVSELAKFIHVGSASHPMAGECIANLVAGSRSYRIHPSAADPLGDGDQLGELIAGTPEVVRDLVVVSEVPDEAGFRLVRFDEGALLDGLTDGPSPIDFEQITAIESGFIRDHRRKMIPAAFGLPGCPLGEPVAKLWTSIQPQDLPSTLPSGVAVELLSRDLIPSDSQTLEKVVGAHSVARDRAEEVRALLEEIIDATGHLPGRPVVFGELVDAVDGVLPAHYTDVDRLDLLLPVEGADDFVATLESIGLDREVVTLTSTSLESGLTTELSRGGDSPITVQLYRTLASGPFGVLVDPHEFHSRAVPIRVGSRWCRALHPAHRFIHGCLRLDSVGHANIAMERAAIQNAPHSAELVNEMLNLAERWGATATVLSVVARLDRTLPGIPTYLGSIAGGRAAPSKRPRKHGRRAR